MYCLGEFFKSLLGVENLGVEKSSVDNAGMTLVNFKYKGNRQRAVFAFPSSLPMLTSARVGNN